MVRMPPVSFHPSLSHPSLLWIARRSTSATPRHRGHTPASASPPRPHQQALRHLLSISGSPALQTERWTAGFGLPRRAGHPPPPHAMESHLTGPACPHRHRHRLPHALLYLPAEPRGKPCIGVPNSATPVTPPLRKLAAGAHRCPPSRAANQMPSRAVPSDLSRRILI